jgi:hypothetical protein
MGRPSGPRTLASPGPPDRPPHEKRCPMPKESHKQKELTLRSGFEPRPSPGTDTVPDLGLPARLGVSTDTMPDQAGVYVPPRPLASVSDHRTIEIAPVRLAREIDPRRAPTELRISPAPPRKQRRPLLLVLTVLLLVAVGGFFAARLVVKSPGPKAMLPRPAPPPVAVPAPAAPAATTVGESMSTSAPATSEPAVVPVTPADLGLRSKAPPPSAPAPRASSDPAKKKVREPWLE